MATSQNGWSVYTSAPPHSLSWVTGRCRSGDVATVFEYLGKRFNADVERVRKDWSWGWAYRAIRGSSSGYSNHASGTAIDLNAPAHPLGRRGTFSARQKSAIHAILRDLDGVVRWGGDYAGRPDEMHFEINASASAVSRVAAKIRGGSANGAPSQANINRRTIESLTRVEASLRARMTRTQIRVALSAAEKTNKARRWNVSTNQDNINKRVIESLTRVEACLQVVMTPAQRKVAKTASDRTNKNRKW